MQLATQFRRAFHLYPPEIPEEGWVSFTEKSIRKLIFEGADFFTIDQVVPWV